MSSARRPTLEQARYFRDVLRAARADTLRDAEAFVSVLIAIEHMGKVLDPAKNGLDELQPVIENLVRSSTVALATEQDELRLHTPFSNLYTVVRLARNAAVHQGAFARHLAHRAIELALLIEDMLSDWADMTEIGDFMVRGVVTAAAWQPVSIARQTLLANSFSYLPIWTDYKGKEDWYLLSDRAVASFLRRSDKLSWRKLLSMSLETAIRMEGLELDPPLICEPKRQANEALEQSRGLPILITGPSRRELIGIATPFDLL